MDGTVLVADDDRTIRTVLTQALTRGGCKVHATSSLLTLMRWVNEGKGDLVITDVIMPDGNGIELVPEIKSVRPELPVIVISAQNTIVTAIQATEADAYHYLPKPFDLPDLMKRVSRALADKSRSGAQASQVEELVAEDLPLVGRSPAMQSLYQVIARVMNADLPILINGESGTGKSLIARTIHDLGDRRTMPLVSAAGADFQNVKEPPSLVNRARNGTLLLDEVADLPLDAQTRIVSMLDDLKEDGPRVIATTQANLAAAMDKGGFRQDLYYRLSGMTLKLPPLRDRIDDIMLLAQHFAQRAEQDGLPARQFDSHAVELLRAYSWPGNVRQLENTVRRLMLMGGEMQILRSDVKSVLDNQPEVAPKADADDGVSTSVAKHLRRYFDLHGGHLPPAGLYHRILREVELPLIEAALDATGGNQAKCAELLGINRNTLRKKITELDIRVARRRKLM